MLAFETETTQSLAYGRFVAGLMQPVVPDAVGALLYGTHWTGPLDPYTQRMTLTYSFNGAANARNLASYAGAFWRSAQDFSAADREATRAVLDHIEAVTQLQFVEVEDDGVNAGTLHFGYSQQPNNLGFAGYGFYPAPSAIATGGDVWIGINQMGAEWDNYRPALILHETLHALGLKHPFEGGQTLPSDENLISTTVMSYSTIAGLSTGSLSVYPDRPMGLDIAALQALYGAASHNEGDTRYDVTSPALAQGFQAIWDTGGTDTLDASHAANAVVLDLRAGHASNINASVEAFAPDRSSGKVQWDYATYTDTLVIADNVDIENAIGSPYDDFVVGNSLDNRLDGGAGNDILVGGPGNDTLNGGPGVDVALYLAGKTDLRLSQTASGWIVQDLGGDEGKDVLQGIERIAVADTTVALDLDGNAGKAARILGAIVGPQFVQNKTALGIAIGLIDAGTSEADGVAMAIDYVFGPPPPNSLFVDWLFRNLTGAGPDASDMRYYTQLLDSGAMTQVELGVLAEQSDATAQRINLVGMAHSGVEYTPSLQ